MVIDRAILIDLLNYVYICFCLFVFYKTHNPIFFCLWICFFVFAHTAEMYLADMISETEYFHVFNSYSVHFRRPGY